HLFGKRKRNVIRWGAMQLLLGSATPRRRLMRLRDLILMLLRAAVVLIVVGALAQPIISSTRLGTSAPRDIVMVLDNSMSTSRKVGTGTVFDRELTEMKRLLHELNGSDRVRVLLTSPRPEWLTSGPMTADANHVSSLVAQLQKLRPNTGAADI